MADRPNPEPLAQVLCRRVTAPGYCDRCEGAAEHVLADPGPLLDTLPDDALVEALVRRGVLAVEWGTGRPPEWAWEHVHEQETDA